MLCTANYCTNSQAWLGYASASVLHKRILSGRRLG
jgi:hypothetical protein